MKFGNISLIGISLIMVLVSAMIPTSMMTIYFAILAVLGLAIGIMNVTRAEKTMFLLSTCALAVIGGGGALVNLLNTLFSVFPENILLTGIINITTAMFFLFAPMVLGVAIPTLWNIIKK